MPEDQEEIAYKNSLRAWVATMRNNIAGSEMIIRQAWEQITNLQEKIELEKVELEMKRKQLNITLQNLGE